MEVQLYVFKKQYLLKKSKASTFLQNFYIILFLHTRIPTFASSYFIYSYNITLNLLYFFNYTLTSKTLIIDIYFVTQHPAVDQRHRSS